MSSLVTTVDNDKAKLTIQPRIVILIVISDVVDYQCVVIISRLLLFICRNK